MTTTGYGSSVQRNEETKSYGADGEVLTRADANGNLTTYEYDGFNRLAKARYPVIGTGGTSSTTDYEGYTYDANNNITDDRRRDQTNHITYTYDARNNKVSRNSQNGYTYDNFDRQIAATAPNLTYGHSFAYDALGRRTSETTPMGTVWFTYDIAGHRTAITWPDSMWASYGYNTVGEMTDACDANVCTKHWDYDNLGRRMNDYSANGANSFSYYDTNLRLSQLTHNYADGSRNIVQTYFYNPAGQLTSSNASNTLYDWKPSVGYSGTYGVNSQNGYTTAGSVAYQYGDGRGNLTSDGSASYQYDVYNRVTAAAGATLSYDGSDRLFNLVKAGAETRFLYEGDQIIGEYNASNQLLRRFAPGPRPDEVVVWYEGAGSGSSADRRYVTADRMGSTIALSAAAGSVLATDTYDEAGVPGSGNLNTFRFQYDGTPWLQEAGLYHVRARAYSPTLGRFMQTDPIQYQGGPNWYAYSGDDPVNKSDPSGLAPAAAGSGGEGVGPDSALIDVKAVEAEAAAARAAAMNEARSQGMSAAEATQAGETAAQRVMADPLGAAMDKLGEKIEAKLQSLGKAFGLPKPPTGKGAVPPSQRDPKRVWTKSENNAQLERQGGNCLNCGNPTEVGEGHHIQRHSDGGQTDEPNHAVVCPGCHKEIHGKADG